MSGAGALTAYADATGVGTATPELWSIGTILRSGEVTPVKTETDITGTTYTVPAGLTFAVTTFQANYDTQAPTIVRLKKQAGGAGGWTTVLRLTLKMHGQDASHVISEIPHAIKVGVAGDVFKLTQESALAKGSLWAAFTGLEY